MLQTHAVTGAFSYSGRYIARRLIRDGRRVITLTNSPHRANEFGNRIRAFPFNFDEQASLTESLRGVAVLYNTYWVRFNHRSFTHAEAVRNTRILFDAARQLEYFRGKAELEVALRETGVSYAVLRPAVLFGKEDILINNIAWMLRRFPVFGVFSDGEYRLQPIYVDDLAALAVEYGSRTDNMVIDAIGPETFTYRRLVAEVGRIIGKPRPVISIPASVGYLVGALVGAVVGDVIITREEIRGLMRDLLCVDSPAAGSTRLTDWAGEHKESLGARYASELGRRARR
jgi:NADH dehydrogenase